MAQLHFGDDSYASGSSVGLLDYVGYNGIVNNKYNDGCCVYLYIVLELLHLCICSSSISYSVWLNYILEMTDTPQGQVLAYWIA